MRFICIAALIFCVSVTCSSGDKSNIADDKGGLQCVGCEIPQNPNRLQYREMAAKALRKYLQSKGLNQLYRVLQVKHVTEQVVAGLITRINFTAVPVICSTDDVLPPYWYSGMECRSETLQQFWLNHESIKISCQPLLQNLVTSKN